MKTLILFHSKTIGNLGVVKLMKFRIMLLIIIFSTSMSSCTDLTTNLINKRIERAFDYVDKLLLNNSIEKLEIPTEIPFDTKIKVSYKTLSPEIIDFSGTIYQNFSYQSAMISIILTFNDRIFMRDYNITISPILESFDKELIISVINVGQGDCILIELPNSQIVMIDAGDGFYGTRDESWSVIDTFLSSKNIEYIDYFIATHDHVDHSKHIPDLLSNYIVKNVYSSFDFETSFWTKFRSDLNVSEFSLIYPNQGDYIINMPGLYLRVITNLRWTKGNASSIMLWLKYSDFSVFFASDGDIENAEKSALDSNMYIKSQILKVGHHGINDSSSSEFIYSIQPEFGVLTTLRAYNYFTHSNEALVRLRNLGVELIETSRNNHIIIKSNGSDYEISGQDDFGIMNPIIVYNYE